MTSILFLLVSVFVFYFGAIIGSFLNVVILRLPHEESLGGRSHCMSCGHVLSPAELFPVFSFLVLGGKCKNCKKPFSWRYFGIECLTGLLFLASWYWLHPTTALGFLMLAEYLFVISVCTAVFFIDLEHFLILDKIVFPSFVLILLFKIFLDLLGSHLFSWHSLIVSALVGAIAGCLPFFLLWLVSKGEWMGFGDVKLMLLLGAVAGWPLVAITLFVAIVLGGIVGMLLLVSAKKTMKSKVPFGTFLTVGGVICLFFGPQLLHWYLSFLGF